MPLLLRHLNLHPLNILKDDYYCLHLNIVMVGCLKTLSTLKVIMVAVVLNKAKLRPLLKVELKYWLNEKIA